MPRPMNSPLVYCRLIHLQRQQHAAVRESILAYLRSFAVRSRIYSRSFAFIRGYYWPKRRKNLPSGVPPFSRCDSTR
jgi:hypothetical protein